MLDSEERIMFGMTESERDAYREQQQLKQKKQQAEKDAFRKAYKMLEEENEKRLQQWESENNAFLESLIGPLRGGENKTEHEFVKWLRKNYPHIKKEKPVLLSSIRDLTDEQKATCGLTRELTLIKVEEPRRQSFFESIWISLF